MAFELKPNRGSLWREEKTRDEDRDYSGQLNVEGRLFWVSGYINETKAGKKYLALSVKPQQDTAPDKSKSRAGGSPQQELNDSIPFAPEVR